MTSAFSTPSGSCDDVRGNLPLYVGRDLDAADLASMKQHLGSCVPCSEELRRAEKAREALLGLRSAVPAEGALDLWGNGLAGQIREAAEVESRPKTLTPIYRFRPLRVAGLAAAAGLLAVAGFQFFNASNGGNSPADPAPNGGGTPIVHVVPETTTGGASKLIGRSPQPEMVKTSPSKGGSDYRLASNVQPTAIAPPPFILSCSTPGCEDAERIAQEGGEGLRRVYIENLDEYRNSMPVLGAPTVIGPQQALRPNPVRTVSWK